MRRIIALLYVLYCFKAVTCSADVLINIEPREYKRDNYCAEVCIQEALSYYSLDVDQDTISQAGGKTDFTGLDNIEQIASALTALNAKFTSWSYDYMDYDEYISFIKSKLDSGFPVLAGVKINPTSHPEWINDHFILVIGYTDEAFMINSPSSRMSRTFTQFKNGDSNGQGYTLTNPYGKFQGVSFEGLRGNNSDNGSSSNSNSGGGGCTSCGIMGIMAMLLLYNIKSTRRNKIHE